MRYCYSRKDANNNVGRNRLHRFAPYVGMTLRLPRTYAKGDIIFFLTPNTRECKKAKKQGATVIFDQCDWWKQQQGRKQHYEMIQLCDFLTISTRELAVEYKQMFGKPLAVMQDTLDWDGITKEDYRRRGVAVWTSTCWQSKNLEIASGALLEQGYRIKVVVDRVQDFPHYFRGDIYHMELVEWNLSTVDRELSQADFMIIPWRDTQSNRIKHTHRMLKAWAIGLPCYVTPIKSHVVLCDKYGISHDCFVDDWSKLKELHWQPKLRRIALRETGLDVTISRWEKLLTKLEKDAGGAKCILQSNPFWSRWV